MNDFLATPAKAKARLLATEALQITSEVADVKGFRERLERQLGRKWTHEFMIGLSGVRALMDD
jgi:hypothetical protein